MLMRKDIPNKIIKIAYNNTNTNYCNYLINLSNKFNMSFKQEKIFRKDFENLSIIKNSFIQNKILSSRNTCNHINKSKNFIYSTKRYFNSSFTENFEKPKNRQEEIFEEKLEKLKKFRFDNVKNVNLMEIYSDSDFVLKHLNEDDPDFKLIIEINLYVIAIVKEKKGVMELRKKLKENIYNLDEELNLYKALYFNLINLWRIFSDLESQQNNLNNIINSSKKIENNDLKIIESLKASTLNGSNENISIKEPVIENTGLTIERYDNHKLQNPKIDLNIKENAEILYNESTEKISNEINKNRDEILINPSNSLEEHLSRNIELLNNQKLIQNLAADSNNSIFEDKENILKDIQTNKLPIYMEAIRDDIFCNYVYEEENTTTLDKKNYGRNKKIISKNLSVTNTEKSNNNTINKNNDQNLINEADQNKLTESTLNQIEKEINLSNENMSKTLYDIYKVNKNANRSQKKFKLSEFLYIAVNISDILYENLENLNNKIEAFPYILFEVYKIYYIFSLLNLNDDNKSQEIMERLLQIFKKFSLEAHLNYSFNLTIIQTELIKLNKMNYFNDFLTILESKLKINSQTSSEDFERIIQLTTFLSNIYLQNFENEKAINLLQNILNNLNKIANNEIENNKINDKSKINSFIKIYRLLANFYGNTHEFEKAKLLCMKAIDLNDKINDLDFINNLFDFNYTLASLATKPSLYLQEYISHFNNIKNLYLQIFEDEPDYEIKNSSNFYENKEKTKDLLNNNKGMEIFGEKSLVLQSESESENENEKESDTVIKTEEDSFFGENKSSVNFEVEKNLLNNTNNFNLINEKIQIIRKAFETDSKFNEIKVNVLLGYMHLIYVLLQNREHSVELDPVLETNTEDNINKFNNIMIKDILSLNQITHSKFFNEKVGLNYIVDWKVALAEYCLRYFLYEESILNYIDLLTMCHYDGKIKHMIFIETISDPVDFILKRLIELSTYIKTKEVQELYEKTLNLYEFVKK